MTLIPTIQTIGVLTGGGDCAGLNAVIRAVVKTAVWVYGWRVLGIEDGFEGLILPDKIRPLTLDDVRGILPRGGTILGTTNRANPFEYEIEIDGEVKTQDLSEDVIRKAKALGLNALVVIGGEGSLNIANKLMQKGLKVVGVPKTIDNDLGGTQVTFGFDTAVNVVTEALDRLHTTAESHHRTLILEVMGRNAGWIALKAGIAGGADIILIPEIPYELDVVIEKIQARRQRKAGFSVIVVAEGARPAGGEMVYQAEREIGGVRRLGGVGDMLAQQLRKRVQGEVRVTVLGYLQRGGSPSAYDRLLASRFGAMAVHLIAEAKLGSMVSLENDRITAVPIAEAIASLKQVPLFEENGKFSDLLLTAFGLGICMGKHPEEISRMVANKKAIK
jgi:ATP-dependent phosphofructokinase / diphosphate-dependent phosphofructokinase